MGIIRKTKSVKKLLNVFEQTNDALSVVELVERFQLDMNKTTVYRALERLEEEGILHSFMGKDGLKWYAKDNGSSLSHAKDTHPHFQCSECGKIECLAFHIKIPSLPNRKIDFAEFLLVGQCEECISSF